MDGYVQRLQRVSVEPAPRALALWRSGFWGSGAAAATVLLVVTTFNVFSLLRTPAPFIDEAWFANRAWGFLQTGLNFGTIDEGVWDQYDGYWTYFPLLPTFAHALAFRMLGLSLFAIRAASMAFGMALLLAAYVVADRLAGRRVALLSLVTIGLSRAFLYSAHLGRPDVIAAAFGWGALALYASDRSTRLSAASVASGLMTGLAFEAHPYAFIYGPTIGTLYLLEHGRALPRSGRFWGFALGAAAGLVAYLGLHVLPYPQTYLRISELIMLGSGPGRTPPLLSFDPEVWAQTAADMAVQFGTFWNLRIPLVAGGLLILWRQRQSRARLLRLCVVLLLAYLFLIRSKTPWYAILAAPAGDLLVAVCLERLWRLIRGGWPSLDLRPARLLIVAGLVVGVTGPTLLRAAPDPLGDYQATLDAIRAAIPPGRRVMGPATYWFGLAGEDYQSWEHLVYYRHSAPGSTVEEALRAFGPDYFVMDTYIEKFFRDTPRPSVNALQVILPRGEMDRFLEKRARLVALVESDNYGQVRIYEIRWDRDPAD